MTESAPSAKSAAALAAPAQPPGKPPQPTEFPPAVAKTIEWMATTFAHWYHQNPPPMPDRFTRREFGHMLWPERPGPPPFIRHKAYQTAGAFHEFLERTGPHSVYYSTAYYRRPGDMKMVEKQWLGAELIFDLDADHLAEAEAAKAAGHEMPLQDQLKIVKTQFKRLLDDFLFGDFGLTPEDVWITFSGGRGYHAHVVEERLMQLDGKARREIVDYITGKFPADREGTINFGSHMRPVLADTKGRGKYAKGVFQMEVATANAPGWGGRLTGRVVELLDTNVVGAEARDAQKWLMQLPGVGQKGAQQFLDKYSAQVRDRLTGDAVTRDSMLKREFGTTTSAGWYTVLSGDNNVLEKVYKIAAAEMGITLEKGETDEPVTADTKRLIRLPGSLHGKSGLKVVTLTRDSLDDFEPLRDAVAFPMDPVRIIPRKDQEATLGGERVAVKGGEAVDVPMPHAVFWLARQGGTIVPKAN